MPVVNAKYAGGQANLGSWDRLHLAAPELEIIVLVLMRFGAKPRVAFAMRHQTKRPGGAGALCFA
jgi:hypothetical protein